MRAFFASVAASLALTSYAQYGNNNNCGNNCGNNQGNNVAVTGVASLINTYAMQTCNNGHQDNLGFNATQFMVSLGGGQSVVQQMILDQNCTDVSCFSRYQPQLQQTAQTTLFGLVFAVIAAALWIFFLPCALCRCWRQCPFWFCCAEPNRPSNFGGFQQCCGFVALVACVGFTIFLVVTGMSAKDVSSTATNALLCDAYSMLDTALTGQVIYSNNGMNYVNNQGKPNLQFAGFNATLTQLQSVQANLTAGSAMINDLQNTITQTTNVNLSLAVVSNVLASAQTFFQTNQFVGNYECVLCSSLLDPTQNILGNAVSHINQTTLQALNNSRNYLISLGQAVALPLGIGNLTQYYQAANTTWAGTYAQGAVNWWGYFQNYAGMEQQVATAFVIVIMLPLLMGMAVVFVSLCRSDMYTFNNPNYPPQNPCCSSCSWCFSLVLAFLFAIVGTIIYVVGYLGYSGCQIINNPTTLINTFTTRFGTSGDLLMSQINVLRDHCLVSGADGNLVDNIVVSGQTIRQAIDYSTGYNNASQAQMAAINTNYAFLQGGIQGGNGPYQTILTAIQNMNGLMLPKNTTTFSLVSNSVTYNAQVAQNGNYLPMWNLGVTAAAQCQDNSWNLQYAPTYITNELQAVCNQYLQSSCPFSPGNYQIKGTQSYMNQGYTYGANEITGSCYNGMANVSISHSPFDEIFNMKNYIINSANTPFTCMTIDSTTGLITGQSACNMDAFVTNTNTLSSTLNTIFSNADTVKGQAESFLTTTFGNVSNLINAVSTILTNTNCGFLNQFYQNFVGHLCYQKVPAISTLGLLWIVFSFVTLVLSLLELSIWRHLKDNRSLWREYCSMGMGGQQIIMGAGGPGAPRVVVMH